jgi:hypothetical protein
VQSVEKITNAIRKIIQHDKNWSEVEITKTNKTIKNW